MALKQLLDLTGRTALVTGGSRGLGLQIASGYGEMGARVVISARKADELEAACAQLAAAGIEASWIAADAARDAEVARLAQEAIAQARPRRHPRQQRRRHLGRPGRGSSGRGVG